MYIDDGFQINIFFYSVGFGMLLAVVYDIFKVVHYLTFKSSKGLFAKDIAYGITAAYLSFLFLLAVNYGRVRVYLIIGTVLGFCCWFFALSPIFVRLFLNFAHKLSSFFSFIVSVISFPFRAIYNILSKIAIKKVGFFKKYFDKLKNISKIHLKKK